MFRTRNNDNLRICRQGGTVIRAVKLGHVCFLMHPFIENLNNSCEVVETLTSKGRFNRVDKSSPPDETTLAEALPAVAKAAAANIAYSFFFIYIIFIIKTYNSIAIA